MKFSLACAALACVAAAAPGSPLRQRTAAERASDKSGDGFRPQSSQNWAGAVQHSTDITKVTGVVKVPEASGGSPRQSGAAWVGIDGDKCSSGLMQTGIDFYGDGSYDACVGDEIYMEVDAASLTVGTAILKILSTGKKASYTFKSPPTKLCETDADWIVEQFDSQLAGFSEIVFTNNTAVTSKGTITPRGGEVIDIKVGSTVKTDCGIDGDDVYCKYLGHH
ncbi:hypothetical protein PWT90_10842 [Aphanocladium album]|nr:hypothetical protein PWT90_10842 [Aphanocladium album]